MTLKNKENWTAITYMLIYPGFFASMLYDLIPGPDSAFAFDLLDKCILWGILLFYLLDFKHLYGDMEATKNPEDKKPSFFIVDLLSCFLYLFSFKALRTHDYWWALITFGILPWLFLWYKCKMEKISTDIWFYRVYGALTGVLPIYALYRFLFEKSVIDVKYYALRQVILSVVVYALYVFFFYKWVVKPRSAK